MAFVFRKEYRKFHLPKNKPQIGMVLPANYIAVQRKGNPTKKGIAYKSAIGTMR